MKFAAALIFLAGCVVAGEGTDPTASEWTFEIVAADLPQVACTGTLAVTFTPPADRSYPADIAGTWSCDGFAGTVTGRTQADTGISNLDFAGPTLSFSAAGIFSSVAFFARAGIGRTGGSLSAFR